MAVDHADIRRITEALCAREHRHTRHVRTRVRLAQIRRANQRRKRRIAELDRQITALQREIEWLSRPLWQRCTIITYNHLTEYRPA